MAPRAESYAEHEFARVVVRAIALSVKVASTTDRRWALSVMVPWARVPEIARSAIDRWRVDADIASSAISRAPFFARSR